jgi:hypothetical protein
VSAAGFEAITAETLEAIKKAQTNGITFSTGLYGYDLSGVVSLVPVNTPFFERVKRTSGEGSTAAHWRALLNINNQQPSPFVGADQGGNYIKFSEMDVLAPYVPVRVSGYVSRDSIDFAKGYADAKAIASTGTLMQWRIQENKGLFGGQAFALPTIATPSVVQSDTGGTIAPSTAVNVKVAARSGLNYYWGGSGVASSQGSVTTSTVAGSTHSATASVAAVKGAVAYDWFVAGFYYTTTVVNTVTITSIPTANAASVPNLPDLFATAPTSVPASDTSYTANSYNGLIASLAGDYSANGLVTPGSGTPSGAVFTSLGGATLTATSQGVTEIDAMLLSLYNNAQLSPTAMIINGQEAQNIKGKILASNQAVMYTTPDGASREGVIGGGSVAGYINGASGGDRIDIVVDPHLPPGRIVFVTERIPYPNSGIANTFEARCLRDVGQFDYGPALDPTPGNNGGPRDVWDVSSVESFINRAPVACGVLTDIGNG